MVFQPEHPVYDVGIYELEVTDPVQGGVGGVANAPHLNLANRTAWLKQQVDLLINGLAIPPGTAPLNGPAFTGSPTAPNVAPGDNSQLIANTNFVQTAKAGIAVVPVGGNVNVTLTQPQWGVGILIFTGVLTGNISVIFPSRAGAWIVSNSTTGLFSLTLRTAAGAGLVVSHVQAQLPAGPQAGIWCDGTNIQWQNTPIGFSPVQQGGGTAQLANKVYLGWDATAPRIQIDNSDLGRLALQTWVTSLFAPLVSPTFQTSAQVNGPLAVNGNIVAQGARLVATLGARGFGDNTVGVILGDFPSLLSTPGYMYLPNNVIMQWGVLPVPVPVDNTAHTYTFPTAFSTFCGAVHCLPGAFTPVAGAMMGAQPLNNSQFNVTIASATTGGSLGTWMFAIGV